MKLFLLSSMALILISCSGSRSTNNKDSGIELADAVEFNEAGSSDVVASSMGPSKMEMAEPLAELGQNEKMYTVQKNETLMIIAFNIYGDYRRWKSIADMNQDVLNGSQNIKEGMQLRYMAPVEEFYFSPSGNPYLIKTGDTLGKISDTTYGTQQHWKEIWNNNKPLIKDPNRIFAGFTIFTPVIEGRDVAFDDL